jgi:ATP-binding cassette subfamily B protein
LLTVAIPLTLRLIINEGILKRRIHVIVELSLAIAGLAILDAVAVYIQGWNAAKISQEVTYEPRTQVFQHVQRQPLAFFSRTQTGSLVSRLNTDIIGAQQAVASILSQTFDGVMTLMLALAAEGEALT